MSEKRAELFARVLSRDTDFRDLNLQRSKEEEIPEISKLKT